MAKNMIEKSLLYIGIWTAAFSGAQSVLAADGQNSLYIEEIIVTPQKREERLQDIPFSVSAINSETIAAANMIGVEDIVSITPSLSFGHSTTSRGEGLQIRGIGTVSFSDGIEGAVGTVLDGVVIGRQSAALNDFVDIERIEVLRGPQSTLFGKNTSAGLINIVTKKPTETFEGLIRASYGTFGERLLNSIVSGPITSDRTLLGRLALFHNERDGYLDQVNPNLPDDEVNNKKEWGGRGKLLYAPSDALSFYFIAEHSEEDQICCTWTERTLSDPTDPSDILGLNAMQVAALTPLIVASDENRSFTASDPTSQVSETNAYSLQVDYDLANGGILRSISAAREFESVGHVDADNTPLQIFEFSGTDTDVEQVSQEFQLLSPNDTAFRYVVGALFFQQEIDSLTRFAGNLGLVPTLIETFVDQRTETTNSAVFGQATYQLSEQWSLTFGGRYIRENVKIDFERVAGAFTSPFLPFPITLPGALGVSASLDADETDSAATGMISLQYHPGENVNTYLTVSHGYKGKGISFNANSVGVLDPEVPTNIELGMKGSFFDRQLFLALTAFQSRFEDFQSFVRGPVLSTAVNLDEVKSQGIEFELMARPTSNLDISAGFAYVDAVIESYDALVSCYPGQTAQQGCMQLGPTSFGQSIEGKDLPNSPDWSANIAATYTAYRTGDIEAYIRGEYSWRDSTIFVSSGDPQTEQEAYGLLNARIGVLDIGHGYEISIWGKNLLDENYAHVIFENVVFSGGYSQFLGMERQVGIDIRFEF